MLFNAGADYPPHLAGDDPIGNGCLDGHSGAWGDEYAAPNGFTSPNGYSVSYGLSDCDGHLDSNSAGSQVGRD